MLPRRAEASSGFAYTRRGSGDIPCGDPPRRGAISLDVTARDVGMIPKYLKLYFSIKTEAWIA